MLILLDLYAVQALFGLLAAIRMVWYKFPVVISSGVPPPRG
jgi:hypothetical protein